MANRVALASIAILGFQSSDAIGVPCIAGDNVQAQTDIFLPVLPFAIGDCDGSSTNASLAISDVGIPASLTGLFVSSKW